MNARALHRRRMRGFGLIEIMIAMTLSLFLLAGIYQVFLSNKMTYNTQQALSRLQENARYVMHTLTHDLRMAGLPVAAPQRPCRST